MRIRIAVPEEHVNPSVIDAALEAVTRLDESLIRSGQSPTASELVARGARWQPEPPGDEHFDHGGTIAARGHGDCDDWAPLKAAELRATGEDPHAVARAVKSGDTTYHAIVQRGDGSIDDPSIAAGMKRQSSSVVGGEMRVWAQDPHDGRIYTGSLLPAVAPLSGHCGPGLALRAAHVVGVGTLYEARCDLPICGSPLIAVRGYAGRGGRRRRVHGALPYAFSCTAQDYSPQGAMNAAITGAVLCGDAAELNLSLDRYKLLATQAALAGHTAGEVREMLVAQLHKDVAAHAAAHGVPHEHVTSHLIAQLAKEGVHVSKQTVHGYEVEGFFDDIGKIASGIVHSVSHVVNDVAKAVSSVPWGDIIHGVQAVVSVVPGLGTAVSEVVAAAETAYESAAALLSGNPLAGALHAAYNFSLGAVPGASSFRIILDPVVNTLINLTAAKEPVETAVLDGILNSLPDSPKIAGISYKSIAASLAHMIVQHLGVKNTGRSTVKPATTMPKPIPPHILTPAPKPAPRIVPRPLVKVTPKPVHLAPPPKAALAAKPLGVPHAAVHVQAVAHMPPPVNVAPRGGSPGAPPGASHWICHPLGHGSFACQWQ